VVGLCLAVAVFLFRCLARLGEIRVSRVRRLAVIQVLASQGTRVAWLQEFQALPQVSSRPAGGLVASR
jgi:hypothetical protein